MAIRDFELVKTAFLAELQKMSGMLLRRALPGALVGAGVGAYTAVPEMGESRMEQALNYGLGGAALTAGAGKLMEHQALKRGRRELMGQARGSLQKLRSMPLGRVEAKAARDQLRANLHQAGSQFEQRVRSTPFYGV